MNRWSSSAYTVRELQVARASRLNDFDNHSNVNLDDRNVDNHRRVRDIAFLKNFRKITSGNVHNPSIKANVVEGVDLDSDGIIDDVEFRE